MRRCVAAFVAFAKSVAAAVAVFVVVVDGGVGAVEASLLSSCAAFGGPSRSLSVAGSARRVPSRPSCRQRRCCNLQYDRYGGSNGGQFKSRIDDDDDDLGDGDTTAATAANLRDDGRTGVGPRQLLVRLNKALSSAHSRRSADKLIAMGRVSVNGTVVTALGSKVDPARDVVRVDGALAVVVDGAVDAPMGKVGESHEDRRDTSSSRRHVSGEKEEASLLLLLGGPHEYVKYWKPVGVTCTCDERVPGNLVEALQSQRHDRRHKGSSRTNPRTTTTSSRRRLFPVGRLDRDTSGLLLLTSDGRLPNSVLKSRSGQPKTYRVTLDRPMDESDLRRLEQGVVITTETSRRAREATNPTTLDGGASSGPSPAYRRRALTARTLPARVQIVDPHHPHAILVTVTEGRNRQVRKMVAAVGYRVLELHRTNFLGIGLGGLDGPGDVASLGRDELAMVQRAIRLHEEEEVQSSAARP